MAVAGNLAASANVFTGESPRLYSFEVEDMMRRLWKRASVLCGCGFGACLQSLLLQQALAIGSLVEIANLCHNRRP
jgi:hypothetical protein